MSKLAYYVAVLWQKAEDSCFADDSYDRPESIS